MIRTGISSTLPIEVLLAAGRSILDLNNRFITAPDPGKFLENAHSEGLPRTYCSWTKGVFAAALAENLDEFVIVTGGDCTHSRIMAEKLEMGGMTVIPFCYPFQPDATRLETEIRQLATATDTTIQAAEQIWQQLQPLRRQLAEVDRLTWETGQVTGFENHCILISGSDCNGDPQIFSEDVKTLLQAAKKRPGDTTGPRLGIVGIPPIFNDLYQRLEESGVQVVYNELAREFSMAEPADGLVDQYLRYTYPYNVEFRMERIRRECQRRQLDGLIHYAQSFCFHHTEHDMLQEAAGLPMLRLEGHEPGPLDARSRTRLDAFVEQLKPRRPHRKSGNLAGLDIGSRRVKLAVLRNGNQETAAVDTSLFYRTFLEQQRKVFDRPFLLSLFPVLNDIQTIAVTGYGREKVRMPRLEVITEVQAHALGAVAATGCGDFTLVDIGGQDTKVIRVRAGRVAEFELNDRCAAGSGRYLENMARILGLTVEELGNFDAPAERLDATCATFGETELVGRILAGASLPALAAGVAASVVERLLPVVRRLAGERLYLAGGGSRCAAIRHGFAGHLNIPVELLPDPEFNGARGCLEYLQGR